MSYYYEPDYYLKEIAKSMSKLADLGESIKERLNELDKRLKTLESQK